MKLPRTIQTRRKTPKSPFRMLQAATGPSKRRRQRATTANAEDLGEVPGVGIARALVVILLLHVAAIAGIWLHNEMSKGNDLKAAAPAEPEDAPPSLIEGAGRATVSAGDNYGRLAQRLGVDEAALRRANEDKILRAGWVINVPERREITRPTADVNALQTRVNPPRSQNVEIPRPNPRPYIQTSESQVRPGSRPGPLVAVGSNPPPSIVQPAPAEEPVYINRSHVRPQPQPQPEVRLPEPRPEPEPAPVARRGHTIKSGDTLYGLSRKYGVSVSAIKRANPGVNPTSLKLGQSLNIPGQ